MTDLPFGAFTLAEYQSAIRREADALLALLTTADPAAPVPACPDWRLRDLVEHVGRVHQWARLNAVSGLDSASPKHPTTGPADGEDLAAWYACCVDDLLKALAVTDPAAPCWTFQPGNEMARFWSRRQSHELTMHRNDADAACGLEYRYDAALAADGVAEVLDVFLLRRRAYGVPPLDLPAPVLIECTDRPERWLMSAAPDDPAETVAAGPVPEAEAVAGAGGALRGPAAGLLLTMWKRGDADTAGLTVDGDRALVAGFLGAQLTP